MKTPLALILLLLLLLLLSACNPKADKIALYLGDSLMAEAAVAVQWEALTYDEAPVVVMNAIPGMGLHHNTEYWLPRIASILSHMDIDVVYVSLGGNDATLEDYIGGLAISEEIDKFMGAFASTTQVYWVLPHRGIGGQRKEVARKIKEAPWGNLKPLNFDNWLTRQGLDPADHLEDDGVHLNTLGERQWAQMLREATQ